ncbi:MAG: DNA topology modulation protein [Planctomycetota bacterium]|jgi:adenylate kinase family enzyme
MRRIAILGCAGAGKSTLALQIGESLGIEVIHLDRHFWKPGWVETPREEWAELQTELLAGESWVADGNYGATLEIRLARADTILFMDMPRRLCLWRILKRRIRYRGRARPDVAPGCPENVDWEFFRWIWNFPKQSRPLTLAKIAQAEPGTRVEILKSGGDVRRFLSTLQSG